MDKQQLLTEGGFLTVFIPSTSKCLVFRIKAVANKNFPYYHYGSLPLKSGDTVASYDGGNISIPADGVLPSRGYTGQGMGFPLQGVYDNSDMWYVPTDYRTRLYHVFQQLTPGFLRTDVQIPAGVTQTRFQKTEYILGVNKDFGFARGSLETIHLPGIHYGYRWGNDTNLNLMTAVGFTYGEYIVEIPHDAELIFNILTRKVSSYWISLPIMTYDTVIKTALLDNYGTEGFLLRPISEKDEAISEYKNILEGVKI